MRALLTLVFLFASSAFAERRVLCNGTIERWVDGDTAVVECLGRRRVRLVGVDTPESSYNKKTARDAEALQVTEDTIVAAGLRAKSLVTTLAPPNSAIVLEQELSADTKDSYGRSLVFLIAESGKEVNAQLVEQGYAAVYWIDPDFLDGEKLLKLQTSAQREQRGLWALGVLRPVLTARRKGAR